MLKITVFLFGIFNLTFCQFNEEYKQRKKVNENSKPPHSLLIEQQLDHFDPTNTAKLFTYNLMNDQFFKPDGPIIIYITGEAQLQEHGVMGGIAFQLSKKFNGLIFSPEHRFFGKSFPFNFKPLPSTESLRYLTIDQTLADMAYSITYLKKVFPDLKNSQVIAIGGSYGGALAVWIRMKYPNIIDMTYACGAVTKLDLINTAYYDVILQSYKKYGEYCSNFIRDGLDEAKKLLKTQRGHKKLHKLLNTWTYKNKTIADEDIMELLLLEVNSQLWFPKEWKQFCTYVKTQKTQKQNKSKIKSFIETIKLTSTYQMESKKNTKLSSSWDWLKCTGFGNFLVTTDSNFGNIVNLDKQLKNTCIDQFGPNFNKSFVRKMASEMNWRFGENKLDSTKILILHGTHDPWYPYGILDDLNEEMHVVYIEGASHCAEIGEEQENEDGRIVQAKIEIINTLSKWIN